MSRSASRLGVLLLAVGFAAGCGDGGDRAAHVPRLPANVARVLAARSDALAVSLEQNDACTAARVPVAFRRKLAGAVTRLTAAVPACTPPDQDEGEGEGGGHDNGKHKGKGKHGGKGKT
jgi:hypothetical protein